MSGKDKNDRDMLNSRFYEQMSDASLCKNKQINKNNKQYNTQHGGPAKKVAIFTIYKKPQHS